MQRESRKASRHARCTVVLVGLAIAVACAPRLAVRPVRYDVDVRVDPSTGTLEGRAAVDLESLDSRASTGRRARIALELHPALEIESVEAEGVTIAKHRARKPRKQPDGRVVPTRHRFLVEGPRDEMRLILGYRGVLAQDVESGEKPGEIHNFEIAAHVGTEGLYLEPDGYWYPRVDLGDDAPELTLADYRLTADPVEGFELVAGLELEDERGDGRLHWSSPFPLEGMVLLGGPLQRWSRQHGDVTLHVVLAPGKDAVAEDILDASAEYLDKYEPLVGDYPFREFTVLEAFFSSGFAFPTCTQIAGSQLSEFKQYRRHGYLDHELLHNWWGNGILVDPRDGNWCEGLASYMGNYYGHVLEEDDAGARKQRRNQSNFLSSIKADQDKPLGTFGRDDGAGRGIGYQKGAAVFHMLEREIGREAMFAGLRKLTSEHMGRHASWEDLRRAFEDASGADLDGFFDQWVRRGGAPLLELEKATRVAGADRLEVTLSQGDTDFALKVPLRLHYGDRTEDVEVAVDEPLDVVEIPFETGGLTAVELDPDFHVFRKLKPEETMPTSSLTHRGKRLLAVVPEGDLAEGYQVVLDDYSRSILGEPDEPKPDGKLVVREAGALTTDDLAEGNVLILGDAVHEPLVGAFMARTRAPVSWAGSGFTVEDQEFAGDGHAVFFTVHHPDVAERGVTVYYGNTPAALSNARVLGFYPNSLLVFASPVGQAGGVEDGSSMPRAEVLRRLDFEFHDKIEF